MLDPAIHHSNDREKYMRRYLYIYLKNLIKTICTKMLVYSNNAMLLAEQTRLQ